MQIGFKDYSELQIALLRQYVGDFEGCFSYNLPLQKIEMPRLIGSYVPEFRLKWIIHSMNHEYLHHIIHTLVDSASCMRLDVLDWQDIACGRIAET